ncbi:membrane protein [Lentzea pudingi]|uniref:Membrane protein n=1 Tax=Lentzea pudingi TaxID=1789439 RepID=A0ABQ2HU68_9PSEU|nr:DUF2238 domain-containing protein [Lentzea pudingi]GGM90874.1 membrane protein [Lentzea pudingi]
MSYDKRAVEPLVLLGLTVVALIASGISPHSRSTWYLEVAPVVIGGVLLVSTYRRFRLTPLLYRLIFLHALVLILGGHYTYARVPAGFWVQDWFDLARNHYDRFAHFVQGFVPAVLAREILLRRGVVRPGGWVFFLVVCVCLAFSATYEMGEWLAAVVAGSGADEFLGTQGDVWDTQWDMFMALLGALVAQVVLGRVHDRELARV